jgi:hypothetical protein
MGKRYKTGVALIDSGAIDLDLQIERMKLPDVPGYRSGYESERNGGHAPAGAVGLDAMTPAERDRLLLEHLPTVRYLARRIHERLPQHVELDDLISAGVVGLIDAFSKFDHGKKVQFKSYAQFRIRGAADARLESARVAAQGPGCGRGDSDDDAAFGPCAGRA